MSNLVKYFISSFKTIYFNFKVFNFKTAIKFPIFIAYDVKILKLTRNCINIKGEIRPAIIKIGFGGTDFVPSQKGKIKIETGAQINFGGKAFFSEGTCIVAEKNASIVFGNNFSSNKNCIIHSCKSITFEDNVLIGWNVNFRDNDGHSIFYEDILKNNTDRIYICKNVWIASYVDVLKGVEIKENSVVATRSCVTKKIDKSNVLVGGYPAKIIKENISWKK